MVVAVYQYHLKLNRAISANFATITKGRDDIAVRRYRIFNKKFDHRSFNSVQDFLVGSGSSRSNFVLELIYD
jgi:hypothetical protein